MPVRIRLRRVGRKKQPSYRIVVAEGQTPRGGTYLDNVGFYNPRHDPAELRIDLERVDYWVARGAAVTPTVRSLIRKAREASPEVPPAEAAAEAEAPAQAEAPGEAVEAESAPAESAEAGAEAAAAPEE